MKKPNTASQPSNNTSVTRWFHQRWLLCLCYDRQNTPVEKITGFFLHVHGSDGSWSGRPPPAPATWGLHQLDRQFLNKIIWSKLAYETDSVAEWLGLTLWAWCKFESCLCCFSKCFLGSSECWTVQFCKVEVMLGFTYVGWAQQLEYLAKYYLVGRSFWGGLMPEVDL